MIKHAINVVKSVVNDIQYDGKRSPKWPALEKKILSQKTKCEACGSPNQLNVHHIKPFHLYPKLELDPNNLIVLCMDKDCHLLIGHGDSFKAYNPSVVEDAKTVSQDITKLQEVADKAKQQRLFE